MAKKQSAVFEYDWQASVDNYGLGEFDTQFQADCYAFANSQAGPTIPEPEELFRRIADTMVPGYFEWHPWTMKMVSALCHKRYVGLSGCSGAAKSYNLAGFACVWWLADSANSSVFLVSTTAKMLRKRIWSFVVQFHEKFIRLHGECGNIIPSQLAWQHTYGDDQHAIFGVSVEQGEVNKSAEMIQGVHTIRQLVVVDEAPGVPESIWIAVENLRDYPIQAGGQFILAAGGNPRSRLDKFGQFIEPEDGWNSVTVDSDDWITKRKDDGKLGVCLRFDIFKSPRIDDPSCSKHLPDKRRTTSQKGNENKPSFWTYQRGFPPPQGMSQTVLTEVLLETFKAYDLHQFTGENFMVIGAYDPARMGDRKALKFGVIGNIADGVQGIEWMPPIDLEVDATDKLPVSYQLSRQVIKHCGNVKYRNRFYTCPPENFGVDASGFGGGEACDVLDKEWGDSLRQPVAVHRVQFAGAASEQPCSLYDSTPANKKYKNKRAEMYFRVSGVLQSGQLKGFDESTAKEFCRMEYYEDRELTVLMDKGEYRQTYGMSPDHADVGCILTEVARIKGFTLASLDGTVMVESAILREQVEEAEDAYEPNDYAAQPIGPGEDDDWI